MTINDISYPPKWNWRNLGECIEIRIENYTDKPDEIEYLFMPYGSGSHRSGKLGGFNSGDGIIKITCALEDDLPQELDKLVSKKMEILLSEYYPEEQI